MAGEGAAVGETQGPDLLELGGGGREQAGEEEAEAFEAGGQPHEQ